MFDKSTINFYNLYVTDSWHIKPTSHLDLRSWLSGGDAAGGAERQASGVGRFLRPSDQFHQLFRNQVGGWRCKGQVYNPIIGFSTIANVVGREPQVSIQSVLRRRKPARGGGLESASIADGLLGKVLGDGKTVIRGGYGQIYSRLNGVGLVLIPLLGVGLGQPVSCIGASSSGQCLGTGGVTPATAFRIGTDGLIGADPDSDQDAAPAVLSRHQRIASGGRGFGAGSELPAGGDLQLQLQHPTRNHAEAAV